MKIPPREPVDASVSSYCCSSCTRSFVTVGAIGAGEALCVCGAALEPSRLSRGVYELKTADADGARTSNPGSVSRPPDIPREHDLGYGASHGLAPGHEGPTGPGDAPAV